MTIFNITEHFLFFQIAIAIAVPIAVSCQRYEPENYVSDYNDYEAQRPAQHAAPRSYSSAPAQRQEPEKPKTTPVAILKQINRHNEDGSYTYGFEGADGSFKIETKLPTGEVRGKYGFTDDTGKVRVVEYGANQYGFQPAGEGITVAPPTLVDETTDKDYQDYPQQQQQQPQPQPRPAPLPARPAPAPRQPVYQQPQYQQPQYQQPQTHTQAIYAPQRPVKQPIFTPSQETLARQSPLLRPTLYDESAPPSQTYNQGPVQFSPAPVQERRSQPQQRSNGGLLDQLARDYALPENVAAPLHDISFGYY